MAQFQMDYQVKLMQEVLRKEVENPNESKPQGRTVIDTLVM